MADRITDEEAVSRVRQGDPDSYEILVARHQSRLKRLARRVLRNEADAEDAVQDAHLLAWRHIGQFAERASFVTWMSTVTLNSALTEIRKRKVHYVDCDGLADTLPSKESDPEQDTARRKLGEAIKGAVCSLPASYRTVFELRDERELSIAETGQRLGLSEGCVKTRLIRARRLLRRSLAESLGCRELLLGGRG